MNPPDGNGVLKSLNATGCNDISIKLIRASENFPIEKN
jgi:hypothetical protein